MTTHLGYYQLKLIRIHTLSYKKEKLTVTLVTPLFSQYFQ